MDTCWIITNISNYGQILCILKHCLWWSNYVYHCSLCTHSDTSRDCWDAQKFLISQFCSLKIGKTTWVVGWPCNPGVNWSSCCSSLNNCPNLYLDRCALWQAAELFSLCFSECNAEAINVNWWTWAEANMPIQSSRGPHKKTWQAASGPRALSLICALEYSHWTTHLSVVCSTDTWTS